MREQLTEHDVEKIREEIEYRKLVVRKEALEAVNSPAGPSSEISAARAGEQGTANKAGGCR